VEVEASSIGEAIQKFYEGDTTFFCSSDCNVEIDMKGLEEEYPQIKNLEKETKQELPEVGVLDKFMD